MNNCKKTAKKQRELVAQKCVTLINKGASWKTVEAALGREKHTLQCYLKEHYGLSSSPRNEVLTGVAKKNRTLYFQLLEKAKANSAAEKKAKEEVKRASRKHPQTSLEENKVLVVETGYLMYLVRKDPRKLKELEDRNVFIPRLCLSELQNLQYRCSEAEVALSYAQNSSMETIQLRKEEEDDLLVVDPPIGTKPRVRGIVAVCSELFIQGLKVHLFTTSKDVQILLEKQGYGKDVEVTYIAANY